MPNSRKIRSMRRILTVLLPLLLLMACSELLGSGVAIRSFTVAGDPVEQGVFVLSWRVDGLEGGSLTLEPGPNGGGSLDVTDITNDGQGQVEVSPQADTEYVLTAVSGVTPSQTAEATVKVVVPSAGVILDFSADVHPVNPGLETTLRWQVDNDPTLRLYGTGLPTDGVEVTGLTFYDVRPVAGADYVLRASSPSGDVEVSLTNVGREVPAASFLIAGQSNAQGRNVSFEQAFAEGPRAGAGVRMLGNDYVWKEAYEPTDDCTDQVDLVSRDPTNPAEPCNSGVSFGVSFGNGAATATGGTVFLIPAAKGGSKASEWLPGSNRYDRSTLFGSATFRARVAELERGAPLGYDLAAKHYGAILWYQGESDSTSKSLTDSYASRTSTIFDTYQMALDVPIIFAQLGRRDETTGEENRNLLYQRVREFQRQLESPAQQRYLVVTHDLPMADIRHLSADAQEELGRRMALAFREHLLGEAGVDGTGPRLQGWQKLMDDKTVRVDFDLAITAPISPGANAYSGYFAVFAGDKQLGISSIERGDSVHGENTAVFITLDQPETKSVDVRYLPPEGMLTSVAVDVVRSATCAEPMPEVGVCLPAPAFGLADGGVALESLQFYDEEE